MGFTYGGIIELDPAPVAPNFRVDLLSVDVNGQVIYTAGTPHPTDPVAPTLSANEAFIAYIVVPYEVTRIEQSWIGLTYTVPYLRTVETTLEFPDGMHWIDGETNAGTFTLLDQYTKPVIANYNVRISITGGGNGELASSGATTIDIPVSVGIANFTYRRGYIDGIAVIDTPVDISPVLHFEVVGYGAFVSDRFIALYDSVDDIMIGA
jgi:hypothetical protein